MSLRTLLAKPFFASRFKLPMHILQVLLVSTAVGLSVPRLFMKNAPGGRAGTMALGMGAKSLLILTYLLLSSHAPACRRWHSYKAHLILAGLEVVFWSAVAGLVFQANTTKACDGVVCTLAWGVVGVAGVVVQTEIWCTAVAFREFREERERRGGGKGGEQSQSGGGDEEMLHLPLRDEALGGRDRLAYGRADRV